MAVLILNCLLQNNNISISLQNSLFDESNVSEKEDVHFSYYNNNLDYLIILNHEDVIVNEQRIANLFQESEKVIFYYDVRDVEKSLPYKEIEITDKQALQVFSKTFGFRGDVNQTTNYPMLAIFCYLKFFPSCTILTLSGEKVYIFENNQTSPAIEQDFQNHIFTYSKVNPEFRAFYQYYFSNVTSKFPINRRNM
jgi:hypothetical protein